LPEAIWCAEDWADMHVSFEVYEQAMDDRPFLEGLPNDRCHCPHWGYVIRGKFRVLYGDREEDVLANEADYLAPGHSIIVDAGTELIEFSPRQQFADHMKAVDENQGAVEGVTVRERLSRSGDSRGWAFRFIGYVRSLTIVEGMMLG
jgi:hypothetical protein